MRLPARPRIAVLASGEGSNFEALAAATARGTLPGEIVALLTDRPGCGAEARARRLGIEVVAPPAGRFRTRLEDEQPWLDAMRSRGVELVLLAGFMRRLHAPLVGAYANRMLNLHPSLLPAFPGLDAIGQALRAGVAVTGCTVHLVDDSLDGGPIVAQQEVPVIPGDTPESLALRMHAAEHALYPSAVAALVREPWTVAAGRVVFTHAAESAG